MSRPQAQGLHVDWGRRPYDAMHALQARLVLLRAKRVIPNLLLTGEHDPVVTLGRKTPEGAAYDPSLQVVKVERGGVATYHGPGQLVAYPIVHLTDARRDLHRFQRDLEEIGLRTLADFGIEGHRVDAYTGVWVGEKKVQSLGIAVRRWVTWHGLALNVNTDLGPFMRFSPCGLDGNVMTSMADLLGAPVDFDAARARLVHHAGELLPGGPFAPGSMDALEATLAAEEGSAAGPVS